MENALVISSSEKGAVYLAEMLTQGFGHRITSISNANEGKRIILEQKFDLCIINTPLKDEFGEVLACNIASSGLCEVILLVKYEMFDQISHMVEEYGVITVAKPIQKQLLWNALKLSQIMHKKVGALRNINERLAKEIEDIKMVDRAKCILISQQTMTEEAAHRYIEKCAMDKRVSRRDMAEEIVERYYNDVFKK